MNEIGQILIEARQQQQIELEQAALETNIAKRYIEALESDNYEVFPAETYVQGFLRNYCEYLGLNSEDILKKYKHIQLQISAPPPDVLLPKNRLNFPKKFILILLIVFTGCLFVSVVFFISYYKIFFIAEQKMNLHSEVEELETIEERNSAVYELNEEPFDKRVFEGDFFLVNINNEKYTLKVKKTLIDLEIDMPMGLQIISMGQSRTFDLNKDLDHDIEITLLDIDKKDSSKGARVLINTVTSSVNNSAHAEEDVIVSGEAAVKTRGQKVLFDGGSAYPVTLNAVFRGYCLFRHEIDKTAREERYYQKSEQISIQAKNGFRIWASNGNAVKLQFVAGGKTVDIEISRPGEVIVKDFKWVKNKETGRYHFVEIDVD